MRKVVVMGLAVVAGLLLLVAGLLAAVYATQPTSFRLARTRTMPCEASALRPLLLDVREVHGWMQHFADPHDSPAVTFSTTTSGVGAWVERKDSYGSGRMTLEAVTDQGVRFSSVTTGRFGQGHATVEFVVRERGSSSSEVEYSLAGDLSGMARLLWSEQYMEAGVGRDLERSLVQLERACTR
jgi:hypothetical protein